MSTTHRLEVVDVHVDAVSAIITDVPADAGAEAMTAALVRGFGKLMCFAQRAGLTVLGHPRAIRAAAGHTLANVSLALPVVVPARDVVQTPTIRFGDLPGMPAWRFSHRGPCQGLDGTYALITEWLLSRGVLASEAEWGRQTPIWEEYVCDPASTLLDEVLTFIYIPRGVQLSRTRLAGWSAA
jgi:effector-binding domain-containing protein